MKITPKLKKIVTLSLISLVSFLALLGLAGVFTPKEAATPTLVTLEEVYLDNHYSKYLSIHKDDEINTVVSYKIPAVDFLLPDGKELTSDLMNYEWVEDSS
ncbi:MAG: hypothetical protein Q7I99_02770, partial [Acholeplasmataceae bacterium]|nr:hypothetical protein [Acholeplasmataceae bacterium]